MIPESQCVLWKRIGAEQTQKQIENLTVPEELDFWRKKTKDLSEVKNQGVKKPPNLSLFVTSYVRPKT